jgi:hypothetical protein
VFQLLGLPLSIALAYDVLFRFVGLIQVGLGIYVLLRRGLLSWRFGRLSVEVEEKDKASRIKISGRTMRKFFLGVAILAFSFLGLAQAEISAFPLGLTEMVWSLRGLGPAQELRLTVEGLSEGKYRVVLSVSLEERGRSYLCSVPWGSPFGHRDG